MGRLFDGGTVVFATAAAVFWFLSAYGKLPPALPYWDEVPETGPFLRKVKILCAYEHGCGHMQPNSGGAVRLQGCFLALVSIERFARMTLFANGKCCGEKHRIGRKSSRLFEETFLKCLLIGPCRNETDHAS